jgi:hypothetical protein
MKPHFRFDFTFPHNYEAKLLEAAPPVHPVEKVYHYPAELEEGDRTGAYVRVLPATGAAWAGFFALGFESAHLANSILSCPDPESVCVVAGGYAYVVKTSDPQQWFQIEQRPVTEVLALPDLGLLAFIGFTSITAIRAAGIAWTTGRLSWEGVRVSNIAGTTLEGQGWDAVTDREVAFTVDLKTGKHVGGATPAG